MAHSLPIVQQGVLFDDDNQSPLIQLDTPAWFAWLDAPSTTRFSYALFNRAQGYIDGFMTVRKERRQRGNTDWVVYRRQGPRLRKIYVGASTRLTQAHLAQIAQRLHARDGPTTLPTFCLCSFVLYYAFIIYKTADFYTGILLI